MLGVWVLNSINQQMFQDQPHENLVFPEEVLPRGNAL